MKILRTNAKGQLGATLLRTFADRQVVYAHSRSDFDLRNTNPLMELLDKFQPGLIINAATYTAVDAAQSDRSTAFAVNADLSAILAGWAAEHSAALIHYSTEYVFNCQSDGVYFETDKMHALDMDRESKLASDRAILESGTAVLILRNAWLRGATGRNFLTAILRQAKEQDALRVVGD